MFSGAVPVAVRKKDRLENDAHRSTQGVYKSRNKKSRCTHRSYDNRNGGIPAERSCFNSTRRKSRNRYGKFPSIFAPPSGTYFGNIRRINRNGHSSRPFGTCKKTAVGRIQQNAPSGNKHHRADYNSCYVLLACLRKRHNFSCL